MCDSEIKFRRGQVWFVRENENGHPTGCEMWGDHYAVIVSNKSNNDACGTVEVVYTTSSAKSAELMRHMHIPVISSGKRVTALCEQIASVDKSRLTRFCGTLTAGEMAEIDGAITVSLGLPLPAEQRQIRKFRRRHTLRDGVGIRPQQKEVCHD